MKKFFLGLALLLCCLGFAQAKSGAPAENMLVSGFKQALSLGTEKAVQMVAKPDGYFSNQAIKILMPDNMKMVADTLAKAGMQKQVDDFTLSMNRAAEKAAPQAASIFSGAIKDMSFEDANKIYSGGDTAALFKGIMAKYNAIPFVPKTSIDIEDYVTTKAMDGLFAMVGQEEMKIRTDPAARTTDVLKSVFGK